MKTCRAITTVLGFTTAALALWAGGIGWAQETPSAGEPVGKAKPVTSGGTTELLDDAALAGGTGDTSSNLFGDQAGDLGPGTMSGGVGNSSMSGGVGNMLLDRLPGDAVFTDRLRFVDKPGGLGAVSVTTFGKPDQKRVDQIAEDLRILSYLFSKNLERAFAGDFPDFKLGIPMLLTANGHSVEASYLEGFGVVLRMRVGFQLVAPPGREGEPGAVPGVSEWDEARRALAGREAPEDASAGDWTSNFQHQYGFGGGELERYSPKLVETLKKHTLALLKNASNLRDLKPDEWIVVSITGRPGPARAVRSHGVLRGGAGAGSGQRTPPGELTAPGGGRPGQEKRVSSGAPSGPDNAAPEKSAGPVFFSKISQERDMRVTMMTIRVKKADADAFAAGTLSEEQFAKQAEVGTYLGPAPLDRANAVVTRWRMP